MNEVFDGRSAQYAIKPGISIGHCKTHEEYVIACEKWKIYWKGKLNEEAYYHPTGKSL